MSDVQSRLYAVRASDMDDRALLKAGRKVRELKAWRLQAVGADDMPTMLRSVNNIQEWMRPAGWPGCEESPAAIRVLFGRMLDNVEICAAMIWRFDNTMFIAAFVPLRFPRRDSI